MLNKLAQVSYPRILVDKVLLTYLGDKNPGL